MLLSGKHCTADLWSEQVTICSAPPFFSQQATWTYRTKPASYSKPTTQMLLCHNGIFMSVHWGTLKDFCSHSRLMKVRCCKFTCSEILMSWRDGGQLKSEWSQRCHLETEMLFKGALLTWKCPEEPAFSKALSKVSFEGEKRWLLCGLQKHNQCLSEPLYLALDIRRNTNFCFEHF